MSDNIIDIKQVPKDEKRKAWDLEQAHKAEIEKAAVDLFNSKAVCDFGARDRILLIWELMSLSLAFLTADGYLESQIDTAEWMVKHRARELRKEAIAKGIVRS